MVLTHRTSVYLCYKEYALQAPFPSCKIDLWYHHVHMLISGSMSIRPVSFPLNNFLTNQWIFKTVNINLTKSMSDFWVDCSN
jgi:hypothetical protein